MPPSPDDVKRFLLASEKPKVRLAISMLYATGMRLDELCHLRCADIIHSSMKIYIRHSKNHSDRYVPLTESIWQMILDYWYTFPAPERPREWLFTQQTRLDHPMDKQWIQREVLLLRRLLEWKICFWETRHEFLSLFSRRNGQFVELCVVHTK